MKVLTYFLYGNRAEYELELTLSILSALRHLGPDRHDITIAVVTDRTAFLPGFPIELITVPAAEIVAWQATPVGKFNHRAKPHALLAALDRYQAPAVLLDTDTYFLRDPREFFTRIADDKSLMHASDHYAIADNALVAPIAEKYPNGVDLLGVHIDPQSEMLNSGVVGVTPANRHLIVQAIELIDQLYSITPAFTIEQFSFGLFLRTYTQLSFCEDILLHYWGVGYRKPFIHLAVSRFMKEHEGKPWQTVVEASQILQPDFPRSPKLDLLAAKILGKIHKWDGSYQFAYLAYRTALSKAAKDPELANLWAQTALLSLGKFLDAHRITHPSSPIAPQHLLNDFSRFAPSAIEKLPWLHAPNKSAWQQQWAACS